MNEAASLEGMAFEQDQRITEVVKREQSRLRNFIRRFVPDEFEAEDVLQDVFYRLVEANRLLMPIDHVTGGLFSGGAEPHYRSFPQEKTGELQRCWDCGKR